MTSREVVPLLLLLGSLLASASEAGAQAGKVGRVTRIVARVGDTGTFEIKTATDKVQLQRLPSLEWLNAARDTGLFLRDMMWIKQPAVVVRVKMGEDDPDNKGELTLTTEHPPGYRLVGAGTEEAIYEIRQDTVRRGGRYALYIAKGTVVVRWTRGQLGVLAAGLFMILSTSSEARAVFYVTPDGGAGYILVESGTLAIIGGAPGGNLMIRAGEGATFEQGPLPVRHAIAARNADALAGFIDYNTKELWSRFVPLWRKPGFWLGAAAVGAGSFVVYQAVNSGNDVGGTITLSIPFP